MIGFACGVLLGTTFFDLLPEAMTQLSIPTALGTVLGSMTLMLLLEWTIGRRGTAAPGPGRLATILLGADGFHNAADGGAIGAAFLVSPRLGVITAAAVIIHEVPEELADYVLLRKAGMSRWRAIMAMAAVQLTAAIGAACALVGASLWARVSGVALAVAAGTFLHIAEVDLVPSIIGTGTEGRVRRGPLMGLLLGIALVVVETRP
jgi:zinc and cadmium transporter